MDGGSPQARGGQRFAAGTGGGPARARQAARRELFPKINQAIIAAAERDLVAVISVVEPLVHQMNLVNLSTALHRLARVSSGDLEALRWLRVHPLVPRVVLATGRALRQAQQNGAPPRCQALSNIVWALATLGVVDLSLLGMVSDLAQRTMAAFKAFELSGMLSGYAQLGKAEPQVKCLAAPVFALAARFISHRFTLRCLVMTAWAYATAGHHDPVLFEYLGDCLLPQLPTASSSELASIAWAFKAFGGDHARLLAEVERVALTRLGDFSPEELVDVLSNSRPRASGCSDRHDETSGQRTQAWPADHPADPSRAQGDRPCAPRDEEAAAGFPPGFEPPPSNRSRPADRPASPVHARRERPSTQRDEEAAAGFPPGFEPAPSSPAQPADRPAGPVHARRERAAVGRCSRFAPSLSTLPLSYERRLAEPVCTQVAGEEGLLPPAASSPSSGPGSMAGPFDDVDSASADEFTQCAEAAAAVVARSEMPAVPSALGSGAEWVAVQKYSVKNTFVDVEDEDEEEEEQRPDPLGPPLDFLRVAGIDSEHLEAYRMHYQKFRARKATGAQGGASSSGA